MTEIRPALEEGGGEGMTEGLCMVARLVISGRFRAALITSPIELVVMGLPGIMPGKSHDVGRYRRRYFVKVSRAALRENGVTILGALTSRTMVVRGRVDIAHLEPSHLLPAPGARSVGHHEHGLMLRIGRDGKELLHLPLVQYHGKPLRFLRMGHLPYLPRPLEGSLEDELEGVVGHVEYCVRGVLLVHEVEEIRPDFFFSELVGKLPGDSQRASPA